MGIDFKARSSQFYKGYGLGHRPICLPHCGAIGPEQSFGPAMPEQAAMILLLSIITFEKVGSIKICHSLLCERISIDFYIAELRQPFA